jgi:hypothetical protein
MADLGAIGVVQPRPSSVLLGIAYATVTGAPICYSRASPKTSPLDVFAAHTAAGNEPRCIAQYAPDFHEGYRDQWGQVSGVYLNEEGLPGQRRVHLYSRTTGRLLAWGDTSPATGAYAIKTPYLAEVKVTCQDDDADPLSNDLVLRTFPTAP